MEHHIKIHSKLQVEATFNYPLGPGKHHNINAEIETYLFIPKSLGINKKTYPKYLFYRDLQTLSELKLKPAKLSGLANNQGEAFSRLRESVSRLMECQDDKVLADVSVCHRVFCKVLDNTVEKHLDLIRREKLSERRALLALYFLTHCREISTQFRALLPLEAPSANTYQPVFTICDEYISLLMEQSGYELRALMDKQKNADNEEIGRELLEFARSETAYRKSCGYDSLPSTRRQNEDLVYRRDALRDYVDSVLHLSSKDKAEGVVITELILSLAAGIAMIFATAVAFMAHAHYENWTTTFFLVLVISYMFKDRIKAQTQAYVNHHSSRFFYDYKTKIFGVAASGPIGQKRETVDFISRRAIDAAVLKERNHSRNGLDDGRYAAEYVIRYKRRIHFYSSHATERYADFPVEGVRNLVRFDFTRFARKMEDAKSTIYIPNGEEFSKIHGRRVTHLHLIIKGQFENETLFRHFRVVLNPSGIKRVEDLNH